VSDFGPFPAADSLFDQSMRLYGFLIISKVSGALLILASRVEVFRGAEKIFSIFRSITVPGRIN